MVPAKSRVVRRVNRILRHVDLELCFISAEEEKALVQVQDCEPWVAEIFRKVRPFTMTSIERISALCHAVRYASKSKIPGDIVECGVWRGGSMMAAALTLLSEHDVSRTLYLFDTFDGMPAPTDVDREVGSERTAQSLLEVSHRSSYTWAAASISDVQANLTSTNYPAKRLRFVKGMVEETVPQDAPERISLLRLDTDWYASTRHELLYLFPRLSVGGVLIIDDYGHWAGARQAVDEYIDDHKLALLPQRIDYTGRIAVKVAPG
jgi:O-methyltransferase